MYRPRPMPLLRRALPVLLALGALAVPATAFATTAHVGHFDGASVAFVVHHSAHGTPYVEDARYHAQKGFEKVFASEGPFETCARHRINAVLFRDICIRGTFTSPDAASGTVAIYQGAHGHRAAHPSDTHHWSATRG
jgi:hypothetical protein